MQFVQERSFIATLTSITPTAEGILDSVEGSAPSRRQNAWLTISGLSTVGAQQQFWFGYHDGPTAGYRVRTVESEEGASHWDYLGLNRNNYLGYYPKSDDPVHWQVWRDGVKFDWPQCGTYEVTIATPGEELLGVRHRGNVWEDRYVQADAQANVKLLIKMDVLEVNVPLFASFSTFRQRNLES